MRIPIGNEHLARVLAARQKTKRRSAAALKEQGDTTSLVGTSLSALFQAATCQRTCSRGPHILEALAGRAYNLGAAAYTLIIGGYYDEALNLVRSIGEISNLIALSATDKEAIQEWLTSDEARGSHPNH